MVVEEIYVGGNIVHANLIHKEETQRFVFMVDKPDHTHVGEKSICKWCGTYTEVVASEECDECWQLRHRLALSPELAERMLEEVKNK
jgi:hypothetical protein